MTATTCAHGSYQCNSALASFNVSDWLNLDPAGHLYYELTWLLRAAQEWKAQKDLDLKCDGYGTEVFAMDSVFVHARSLFEFFVSDGKNCCHAQCFFDLSGQFAYPLYDTPGTLRASRDPKRWGNILHLGAMHLQNRGSTNKIHALDGTDKDLSEMVEDFAQGVLVLWKSLENDLKGLGRNADAALVFAARERAVKESGYVVDGINKRSVAYQGRDGSKVKRLFSV